MPWRFNPFADIPKDKLPLAAAGIVEVFKKLWPDDWGPRLEHLLRNVVYTLLETPGSTLADIPALLADRTYRSGVVASLDNPVVQSFWRDEFREILAGFPGGGGGPLQNKIGALLTDPVLRRILTEPGPTLNLRQIMDERKILIVSLDKGRIGEGPSMILGSFPSLAYRPNRHCP